MRRACCFNTASGMDCMQFGEARWCSAFHGGFNTASGMDCMQFAIFRLRFANWQRFNTASGMDCMQLAQDRVPLRDHRLFQYRKRYGLHAISILPTTELRLMVSIPQAVWIACNKKPADEDDQFTGFNTASGMDCMQLSQISGCAGRIISCFNTASGMDCMQCGRI